MASNSPIEPPSKEKGKARATTNDKQSAASFDEEKKSKATMKDDMFRFVGVGSQYERKAGSAKSDKSDTSSEGGVKIGSTAIKDAEGLLTQDELDETHLRFQNQLQVSFQKRADITHPHFVPETKPVVPDTDKTTPRFYRNKVKPHRMHKPSEIDQKVPRFVDPRLEPRKYMEDGTYFINSHPETWHGTMNTPEDAPMPLHARQRLAQLQAGTAPSQMLAKNCHCNFPACLEEEEEEDEDESK